jgi:DNA-binding transcriptional ArsR family regulator
VPQEQGTPGAVGGPQRGGDAEIAEVGALLGDRTRCRVLMALGDGRALPASVLADEAGVSRPTASGHLARLVAAGLLAVETSGRHRYYRLAGPEVGQLLETLVRLAPAGPVRSLREGNRAARLRAARTCYDHLAGRLGTGLMGSLLRTGALEGGDGVHRPETARRDRLAGHGHDVDYVLTAPGRDLLDGLGVRMPQGRRPLVRYCVDWSEQRHHLAGGLGRALLDRFLDAGWIARADRGRAVTVTPQGRGVLAARFGIPWE